QLLINSVLVLLLSFAFQAQAQAQEIEWDKTYGGSGHDWLLSLQHTSDGGYILGGTSDSGISGDKTKASRGEIDFWIIKIDRNGSKQWDRVIGGSAKDSLTSLQQTSDGGYILGGSSNSGISGDKSEASRGGFDYWIVKLDAEGNKEWDKTFGGNNRDELTSLQQTKDGGYILGGSSLSGISGDKTVPSWGASDYWVIKLNSEGMREWDKAFGGNSRDMLTSLQQTKEGGYILGGYSASGISGDKTEESRGLDDYWALKLDAKGNKEWDKTLGGSSAEYLFTLQQTIDNGYILGGGSSSIMSGDKTEDNRGKICSTYPIECPDLSDYWVVKLDAEGKKEWDRTLGGNKQDFITTLQQAEDGGYVLGGWSESGLSGDKSEASKGFYDYWLVKLNISGTKEWDKTFGGDGGDYLRSLEKTIDGGYILGGSSSSGISGDKTEFFIGLEDYWVIKLSPEEACTPPTPSIAVVPTSTVYTGGDAGTIYLGYGPQRVRLVASGAERYEWSPAEGLSDPSVADPVFTPTAAGSYTFTVTAYNGTCSATASVTITVIDVRCGNGKVLLCHKGKQICISASAVAAHLRNHPEDRLGSCGTSKALEKVTAMRVYPNPLSDRARVELSLPVDGSYRLELYSANGKRVGVLAEGRGKEGEQLQLELGAEKLHKGVYYLRLVTSDEVQTLRLMIEK
ncbi:MAG: T9SS type A sorting domain-containing protein, partial [Hymenobacteraceae bacterium]|nr:T9SS type A sorting domain-containing protein [Hymenobacteraceae bacterium]